jgi:hypothetical protein
MQKSWFYLGAIGSLAILMSGCGDSQPAATPAASPTAAATPAATAPVAAPAPTAPAPAAPAATTPAVAAKPATPGTKPVPVDVAAGLIPPTNGENWAKTVAKGRTDPFATLALQPTDVATKEQLDRSGKPQQSGNVPLNRSAKSPTATTATVKVATNRLPTGPAIKSGVNKPLPTIKTNSRISTNTQISTIDPSGAAKPNSAGDITKMPTISSERKWPKKVVVAIKPSTQPAKAPNRKQIVALKPVPQPLAPNNPAGLPPAVPMPAAEPTLARTVSVSGIMQVDGKTQVIVKLPNESFSRYVEVGDRIYDGKIKVKRIEGQQTISPTVVLEEVGVEVHRKVGDVPAATSQESQPK